MKKMKKVFFMMLLGLSICLAGQQAEVLASEYAPENEKDIQEMYVDLSGEIIQEGGFLKKTDISEKRAGASGEMTDTQRMVQSELLAAWDSFADSCNLRAYQISGEDLEETYAETINGSPEYFYVKGYSYTFSMGKVIEVRFSYIDTDKNVLRQMKSDYDRAVAGVVSKADDSWSDMEKALYINDYLARNCEYDNTYTKYSSYEALVNRTAVCQGYALAFMDLAHELGLSCEMVSSESLNHAWDMVKIGDSYYHVDVTWNDPVEDRLGRARHWYFMKSSSFFKSEEGRHLRLDDWVMTGAIDSGAAGEEKYDGYFWNRSDTGFDYLGGYWYGFNGVDSICKYTCNGTDFTETELLKRVEDIWLVIGGGGSYYTEKYVGTGAFNGKFYYSGRDAVYELDPGTGESTDIFELSEDQKKTGYIYGLHVINSGELQYNLSGSPNEPGAVYTAMTLDQTPKNDSYRIYFQGNGAESGSMDPTERIESGKEFQLPANQFRKNNFTFSGWNTKKDGSGESYQDQAAVSRGAAYDGEKFTLYAQWIRHIHTPVTAAAVSADCTTEGKTEGSYCSGCGEILQAQEVIPALGHDWDAKYTVDKAATAEEPGWKSIHCRNCDEVKDIQPIPVWGEQKTDLSLFYIRIDDEEEFVYDGQEKRPAVTVENEDTILPSSNYQVEYSQNIHAGTAKIAVTGKGGYTGTITETFEIQKAGNKITAASKYTKTAKTAAQTFKLNARAEGGDLSYRSNSTKVRADRNGRITIQKNFVGKAVVTVRAENGDYKEASADITITVNPAGTRLSKVKNVSGRKVSVKWKKNSQVSGYQIQYAMNRKFSGAKSKTISGGSKTGTTLKGFKKKKTYYVRIRTYKVSAGVRYYSAWSTAQNKVKISR